MPIIWKASPCIKFGVNSSSATLPNSAFKNILFNIYLLQYKYLFKIYNNYIYHFLYYFNAGVGSNFIAIAIRLYRTNGSRVKFGHYINFVYKFR